MERTMSDEDVIAMLQGLIFSLMNLPEEQLRRIWWSIIERNKKKTNQSLFAVGRIIDAVQIMNMDNFDEVVARVHISSPNLGKVA